MLDALKFVQGAVAKKDYVPALTHFRISEGRIVGYNGKIGLSSPIDLDLEESITPKASTFFRAIQSCQDTVAMHMTKSGRLAIKSGRFKAFVECTPEPFPEIAPEGEYIELDGSFIDAIKTVAPFIGQDASRPWSRGILFRGQSVFATNNIVLIEHWLGYNFPVTMNVPATTVDELLRIKETPIGISISEQSVTFHFEGDRWLRSQLASTEWPDLEKVLNVEATYAQYPPDLVDALESIKFFTDEADRVYIAGNTLSTSREEGDGASIELDDYVAENGIYQLKQLALLAEVVNAIDFSHYPRPVPFMGENLRGAIVGMRG